MIPTGKVIQVQQLAGRPYVVLRGPGHPRVERPPFGELYVDDAGNPVAVVCHLKRPVEVPGLTIADVQPARHGMKRVTYVKAYSLDPRPPGPGQGA